ncbi:MAG: hypothetical protein Tsb0014_18720 [Pleurocapsa sp.]
MSALPKPSFPIKASPRRQKSKKRRKAVAGYHPLANTSQVNNKSLPVNSARHISGNQALPANLQVLMLLQRCSFGVALISMVTSIGVYISTVRIPQQWSQEYEKLETLQRQERQLTTINETIRYEIAKQAGQEKSELSILNPDDAIFVTPAEVAEQPSAKETNNNVELVNLKYNSWGY